MTRESDPDDHGSTVRDAYGFTVHPAYTSLFRQFSQVSSKEEAERSLRWDRWLASLRKEEALSQNGSQGSQGAADKNNSDDAERLLARALNHYSAGPSGGLSPNSAALLQQLRSLVQMGVPMNRRATFWKLFLNVDAKKREGEYQTLVTRALEVEAGVESKGEGKKISGVPLEDTSAAEMLEWLTQIDKDLHRTFPDHPSMDLKGRAMLRRILAAYAYRSPSVGYCQGLNFLAAAFMLFLPEEDAFWCLAAVIEDLMQGYFDMTMAGPQVDARAFAHLLRGSAPRVAAHLDALQVDAPSATSVWFMVAFLNSLPTETCWRVWDVLFFERSPVVLFRVALALIDIYSQALLETRESSDAYMLLQALGPMSFDSSRLIDTACIGFGHVKDVALRVLRDKYAAQVAEGLSHGPDRFDEEALASFSTLSSLTPLSRSQSLAEALARVSYSIPPSPSPSQSQSATPPRTATATPLGTPTASSHRRVSSSSASPRSPLASGRGGGSRRVPPSPLGQRGAAAASVSLGGAIESTTTEDPANNYHPENSNSHAEIYHAATIDGTDASPQPVENTESNLLDFRSPMPSFRRRQTQAHCRIGGGIGGGVNGVNGGGVGPLEQGIARRTRSAAPVRQPSASSHRQEYLQQQQRIDLHRVSAFVPDMAQPAVASAYRIAANPSPKGKSRWSRENSVDEESGDGGGGGLGGGGGGGERNGGYTRTPMSLVLPRLQRLENADQGQGWQGQRHQGQEQGGSHRQHHEGDGGWTIDVGSLAQAIKALRFEDVQGRGQGVHNNLETQRDDDGQQQIPAVHAVNSSTPKQDPVPRRFTDGGALLMMPPPAAARRLGGRAWRQDDALVISTISPIHEESPTTGTPIIPGISGHPGLPGLLPPPLSPSPAPMSPIKGTRLAKEAQLQRLLEGLHQEVSEGERRAREAQHAARDVEDTIQALHGQLSKLQGEVDHKMDILHVLLGRVADVDRAMAEIEGRRGELHGTISGMLSRRVQLQREVTSKSKMVRALMNAMTQTSMTPPGSPAKSPSKRGGGGQGQRHF